MPASASKATQILYQVLAAQAVLAPGDAEAMLCVDPSDESESCKRVVPAVLLIRTTAPCPVAVVKFNSRMLLPAVGSALKRTHISTCQESGPRV